MSKLINLQIKASEPLMEYINKRKKEEGMSSKGFLVMLLEKDGYIPCIDDFRRN